MKKVSKIYNFLVYALFLVGGCLCEWVIWIIYTTGWSKGTEF